MKSIKHKRGLTKLKFHTIDSLKNLLQKNQIGSLSGMIPWFHKVSKLLICLFQSKMDQGQRDMARQRDHELPDPEGIHFRSGAEQRKSRIWPHRHCKRSCNLSILPGNTLDSMSINFKSDTLGAIQIILNTFLAYFWPPPRPPPPCVIWWHWSRLPPPPAVAWNLSFSKIQAFSRLK